MADTTHTQRAASLSLAKSRDRTNAQTFTQLSNPLASSTNGAHRRRSPLEAPSNNPTTTLLNDKQRRRSPNFNRAALQLGKSTVTGRRNKEATLSRQVVGAAMARGGQALGGFLGSYVPVIGTVAGAAFGKRVGRIMGEHWPVALFFLLICLTPIVAILSSSFFSVIYFLL